MKLAKLQELSRETSKKAAKEICIDLECTTKKKGCPGNLKCSIIKKIMKAGNNAEVEKRKKKKMYATKAKGNY